MGLISEGPCFNNRYEQEISLSQKLRHCRPLNLLVTGIGVLLWQLNRAQDEVDY
jgi:hypothetical protein